MQEENVAYRDCSELILQADLLNLLDLYLFVYI